MALAELRHRPLVFVADLDDPELEPADRNHLARALRLRDGDGITIADGRGRWRPAGFGDPVRLDGPVATEPGRTRPVVVGFAPVKGDRSDLVVQKLTELGVDRIVPLTTRRSVVRWDEARVAKNLTRHRRIVREAAMQSRNLWPPDVAPMTGLEAFLSEHPDAVLADPAAPEVGGFPNVVVIGPEGGFAPEELSDRPTAPLPGRVLRTETAAIVAAALAVAAHPA